MRIPSFRNLLIAALALGGAIYLVADPRSTPAAQTADEPAVKRVKIATVEAAQEARTLRFSGLVRAAQRAGLAFTIGGRMEARPVEVGERVRAGQLLAQLDERELINAEDSARAARDELSARRAQTVRDHERVARLHDAKAATDEELEQVAAALDTSDAAESAATARLREAKRRLGEARLVAPFDATVTAVHLEPGEHAMAGNPVVVLSGVGIMEVEVEVPESVIHQVREGEKVRIDLPALGIAGLPGRVTSVGRTAAGPGHLFPVVASLEAGTEAIEKVIPGMTAELVLAIENDASLSLPVEAVINPGGSRPSVFRVVDGRAEKVVIEVGALIGDRVAIASAAERATLSTGDRVVIGGQRGLIDGEGVEVWR